MQEVEYSIIVPVYKAENTIKRCVESILAQTYEKFEVILIDDGSPDRAGEICDYYAGVDNRVKVIHQKNGGVSAARNAGLDSSIGEYIIFVDSDDYLEQEALSGYSCFTDDLLVSGVTYLSENGTIEEILTDSPNCIVLDNDRNIIDFLKCWYAIQVWGKRYKRSIILSNRLCFNETMNYGEDNLFNIQYSVLADTIRITGEKTYYFCKSHNESLSKQGDRWIGKYSSLQLKIYEFFKGHSLVQDYIMHKYWWSMETHISEICCSEISRREKRKKVAEIIGTSFFQECVKKGVVKMVLEYK